MNMHDVIARPKRAGQQRETYLRGTSAGGLLIYHGMFVQVKNTSYKQAISFYSQSGGGGASDLREVNIKYCYRQVYLATM